MTDQQLYDLLWRFAGEFHYVAPWVTLALSLLLWKQRRDTRAHPKQVALLEQDRDEWRELACKNRELANKNYEAGMTWKSAFENRKVTVTRTTQVSVRKVALEVPELGHCHDPRCEARTVKVHACHDLTCKQHIHETRAR